MITFLLFFFKVELVLSCKSVLFSPKKMFHHSKCSTCFLDTETAWFVVPIADLYVCLLCNVKCSPFLGINKGILHESCIVDLPDEVCINHTN